MGKKIEFNYDGKDYTLGFTRKSIIKLEEEGFVAEDMQKKPMTTLPQLFAGSFIASHPFIQKEKVEEIYDLFTDKTELIEKLGGMYAEPLEALFSEPKEKNAIKWKANF